MGGKRKKSSNGPIKKESKYKIPRRFDCPICDAKASIAVKVTNRDGSKEAHIKCRNCSLGANSGPRPMLPLEKAVDAFFEFREELMERDRAYLERFGLNIGGVVNPTYSSGAADGEGAVGAGDRMGSSGAASTAGPVVRNLAELERIAVAATGVAGRGANRPRTRRGGGGYDDYDDVDEAAEAAAQHFQPRRDADSDGDDYDDMFS